MRVSDFDEAVHGLLGDLTAAGVQLVVLEDDDDVALTLVPGPASRNLDRLARALRARGTRLAAPGPKLDWDAVVRGGPRRWPLLAGDVAVDVLVLDVADGRWTAYYEEARPVALSNGLAVQVVPDAPILQIRRADARAALPELALTQRERDRERLRRRHALLRAERRAARRGAVRRLVGRA